MANARRRLTVKWNPQGAPLSLPPGRRQPPGFRRSSGISISRNAPPEGPAALRWRRGIPQHGLPVFVRHLAPASWEAAAPSGGLIVVDGDNDLLRTTEMLGKGLQFADWISVSPNPSIEVWLGVDASALRKQPAQSRIETVRQAAEKLDISALREQDEQFAKFYDAILGA
jgi:hypothetical protein